MNEVSDPAAVHAVDRRGAAAAICIAILLVSTSFALYGDVNLNLADEGFLWYGAERTIAGEVPLRDFQSYEPGRYYWISLGSVFLGDGLLSLRLSVAIFQAIGLAFALLVVRRIVVHPGWLLPIGILMLLWMFPRYKAFDASLSMMAVYMGMRLLEAETWKPYFAAGVFVGLAGFFGRNHALYAGLGISALTLWRHWDRDEEALGSRIGSLVAGGLVGALPMAAMVLFVPGFAVSLWESVVFFVEHGANLPASAPLPWRVDYAGLEWRVATAHFLLGCSFLLVPVVYLLGAVIALRRGRDESSHRRVLVAATALGVFYLHHAAVRSDATHLAESIQPALLAALAIPGAFGLLGSRARFGAVWGAIVVITLAVTPYANSEVALLGQAQTVTLVPLDVAGDRLRVSRGTAGWASRIQVAVARHVGEEDALFIAPYTPGLYPLLGKTSPVWEIYLLWAANEDRQQEMIARLERKNVDWALISSGAIDKKDELRFWNTHDRVWAHLKQTFEIVPEPQLPEGMMLLRRREGSS